MEKLSLLVGIVFVVFIFSLNIYLQTLYQITPHGAKSELKVIVGTDDYEIINMSNNGLFFGSPGDVTFNLQLKDSLETVISCRCTDGLFQPLICRKYQ